MSHHHFEWGYALASLGPCFDSATDFPRSLRNHPFSNKNGQKMKNLDHFLKTLIKIDFYLSKAKLITRRNTHFDLDKDCTAEFRITFDTIQFIQNTCMTSVRRYFELRCTVKTDYKKVLNIDYDLLF